MRLIQAKVRCVEGVLDTGWFVPGRETTIIFGPPGSGKTSLLHALQSLNPLYDISREHPLVNHPKTWRQGVHTRKVLAEKKTAVFMVFSAEPRDVLALEKIDPDLIETDRIEVGRRLDYTRWTTFVEIPASSRWSEIFQEMTDLRESLVGMDNLPEAALQDSFFHELGSGDRLIGTVADDCQRWLEAIAPFMAADMREVYQHCLHRVGRAQRFLLARQQVAQWLPLTIHLHPGHVLQYSYSSAELFAESDPEPCEPIVLLLRMLCAKYSLFGEDGGQAEVMAEPLEGVTRLQHLFHEMGLVLPSLRMEKECFILEGYRPRNILEQRLYLIGVTCLLGERAYGHGPLLLLDGFDDGLSPEDITMMIAFQQKLGRLYQLISATSEKGVAESEGWQAVHRIGPGGLLTAGFTNT